MTTMIMVVNKEKVASQIGEINLIMPLPRKMRAQAQMTSSFQVTYKVDHEVRTSIVSLIFLKGS